MCLSAQIFPKNILKELYDDSGRKERKKTWKNVKNEALKLLAGNLWLSRRPAVSFAAEMSPETSKLDFLRPDRFYFFPGAQICKNIWIWLSGLRDMSWESFEQTLAQEFWAISWRVLWELILENLEGVWMNGLFRLVDGTE